MKKSSILLACVGLAMLQSCSTTTMVTRAVAYQSVRPVDYQESVPDDAVIDVGYSISSDGKLTVNVHNRTDEIMIIDQTKSFFVNSNGVSTSYYDPTVYTTTQTDVTSTTTGASMNLGAVGRALGAKGFVGDVLNSTNVGGASTTGTTVTNTSYSSDLPQVSLAPNGKAAMSKTFTIGNVGEYVLAAFDTEQKLTYSPDNSYARFSVCITYSTDNGRTFDKLVSEFYANTLFCAPVGKHGRVNDSMKEILSAYPASVYEPWAMWYFNNNVKPQYAITRNNLIDFK